MSAIFLIGSAADGLGRPSDVKSEVFRRGEAGSSLWKLTSMILSGTGLISVFAANVIISFSPFLLCVSDGEVCCISQNLSASLILRLVVLGSKPSQFPV